MVSGQLLIYENSHGKLTFGSQVKYRHPDGDYQYSVMPVWDSSGDGSLPLGNCSRAINDATWDYFLEAETMADGFKIRLTVRNISKDSLQVANVAPVVIRPDFGQLVLGNKGSLVSWLKPLGYQSSSSATTIKVGSRQLRGRFTGQREMADNYYPDQAPEVGKYILDWQAVVSNGLQAVVIGAITSDRAISQGLCKVEAGRLVGLRFASLFDDIEVKPGEQLHSEWLYLTMTDQPVSALQLATSLWGQNMGARNIDHVMSGWAPQLRYKNRITQQQMEANLKAFAKLKDLLPLDFFTIGDGYQRAVGDWFDFSNHYQDLPKILTEIGANGLTRAMWSTPFVCQSDSKLMHEHPDWLLRDSEGNPRIGGSNPNWRGRFYVLDLTNPDYLAELKRWFSVMSSWGVRFFKVGLTYAGALPGRRHDSGKTGLEALRHALAIIREAIGDAYLDLGSVPFGAGVGLADAMRVGPPVDRFWQSQLQLLSTGSNSFASAANSIEGTLNRWYIHRNLSHAVPSWAVSSAIAGNKLSTAQLRTLYTSIAISGGVVNISEDLAEIEPDKTNLQRLFPLHPFRPEAVSLSGDDVPQIFTVKSAEGDKYVIAFFNWGSEVTTKSLDLKKLGPVGQGGYHLYDPWENTYYGVWSQNELKAYHIAPYGCRVFVATKTVDEPQLIGVNPMIISHLLPGITSRYESDNREVKVTLKGFKGRNLELWFSCPAWCLNQHIKVSGGSHLETAKRGPIISCKISCSDDQTIVAMRCLDHPY